MSAARTCAICFEPFSADEAALLVCGHTLCACDAASILRTSGRCPFCRADIRGSGRGVFYGSELRLCQSVEVERHTAEPVEDGDARYAKYGSKLQSVVGSLLQVLDNDPAARVLLFVQWADLEAKVSTALEEFEVPHARLASCNDVFERRDVLECFQSGSGPSVLLLSLEQAASGAHLTAANHIFMVHPIVAASEQLMRAYDQQAIGRAVRLGQTHKVTVWRFVTSNTLEERLVELLQQDSDASSL